MDQESTRSQDHKNRKCKTLKAKQLKARYQDGNAVVGTGTMMYKFIVKTSLGAYCSKHNLSAARFEHLEDQLMNEFMNVGKCRDYCCRGTKKLPPNEVGMQHMVGCEDELYAQMQKCVAMQSV